MVVRYRVALLGILTAVILVTFAVWLYAPTVQPCLWKAPIPAVYADKCQEHCGPPYGPGELGMSVAEYPEGKPA